MEYTYKTKIIIYTLFTSLILIIYAPSINAPFYLDDIDIIQNEGYIQFNDFRIGDILNTKKIDINKNRIISYISLGISYHFYKQDTKGYHYINILIHILISILLYEFIITTLTLIYPNKPANHLALIAFSSALLWLTHPIQTQAVTYIIQRMTLLATFFYILSILLYVKARLNTTPGKSLFLFTGCILSGLLAFGSKEIAATLPFFILLYEWFFIQDLKKKWLLDNRKYFLIILFLLITLSIVYTNGNLIKTIIHGYEIRPFTLEERLLTEPRVILFYISLLLFPYPARLSLEHDFHLSTSLFSPATTFFSIIFILASVALALLLAKKYRLYSFAILWFLGNLFIESSIIPLELVFEHRLYLPTMLLFIIIPTILLNRFSNIKHLVVITGIVSVTLCLWTYKRNSIWANPLLFNQHNIIHAENSYRAHNDYGRELVNNGRIKEGFHHFTESIRLNPEYFQAHYNYGLNLIKLGNIDQGISHLTRATNIRPHSDDAHNNLGIAFGKKGNFQEALKHFNKALEINPNNTQASDNLTMVTNYLKSSNIK